MNCPMCRRGIIRATNEMVCKCGEIVAFCARCISVFHPTRAPPQNEDAFRRLSLRPVVTLEKHLTESLREFVAAEPAARRKLLEQAPIELFRIRRGECPHCASTDIRQLGPITPNGNPTAACLACLTYFIAAKRARSLRTLRLSMNVEHTCDLRAVHERGNKSFDSFLRLQPHLALYPER